MNYLNSFQKQFNKAIFSYLDNKIENQRKIDGKADFLSKIIKQFIQQGGKKFRPALFYAACKDYPEKRHYETLKYSFIFELIHTFALIHDDIIDHAPIRRGKPTVHVQYDTATAILAGDMALIYADELFLEMLNHVTDKKTKQELQHTFDTYKQELIIGQYLDVIHIPDYEKIIQLKTSYYSFVRPVEIALISHSCSHEMIESWKLFLVEIGKLFQMKDDYEGVFGDEEKMGKSVTSDTEEGKFTHIVKLFMKTATLQEKTKFTSFFGKGSISQENFIWYRRILKEKKIDVMIKRNMYIKGAKIMRVYCTMPSGELKQLVKELLTLILKM